MSSTSTTSSPDLSRPRVGIAGLGRMGSAMAARLVDCGFEVIAWDRDPVKAERAGLDHASTPCALADACPVVISSLFDTDAVSTVYRGSDGLLASAEDTLFIEMSTVSPESQIALARDVAGAGGQFIECPVSGTVAPARAGQLLGFAGGAAVEVDAAEAILDHLCRRVVRVEPVGAGARTKLAVNLPLIAFWQALGEVMALMHDVSGDAAWLVELFADTPGAPAAMKVKAEAVTAALGLTGMVEPAFAIDAMRKDLQLAIDAASGSFPLPVATSVLAAMDEAAAAGCGDRDCAWMPAFWAMKAAAA